MSGYSQNDWEQLMIIYLTVKRSNLTKGEMCGLSRESAHGSMIALTYC